MAKKGRGGRGKVIPFFFKFLNSIWVWRKKERFVDWCAVFGGVIFLVFFFIFRLFPKSDASQNLTEHYKNAPYASSGVTDQNENSILSRRLDGMLVAAGDSNKLPLCVMIDNAAFGGTRPQAGLSRALVVYEVIVEGGITRFMAVFGGEEASKVGPIRSSRDTFLEFASEYNCPYFHAGGSYTALRALINFKMRYVDALREPQFFWRDSTRYNPHNLFSSTEKLALAAQNHHWLLEESPNFASWTFVEAQFINGENAQKAEINFTGAYNVRYNYNSAEGYYERSQGGTTQTDEVNGEILSAKNVILQFTGEGIYVEGKGRVNWPVTGEGEVIVLRAGKMEKGTWRKASRSSRTLFFSTSGEPLKLTKGNIWVEIIPPHIKTEIFAS